MMEHRPFASLGAADHGWLDARHHFSFAGYHDPQRMHWGRLRVWNDDTIQPRTGFPLHPHADMEIITYVREGAITHEDSLGNKGRTEAGDVQVMSAGTGIRHSEYNLESGPTRLFQIWILPDARGHAPAWGTRPFPREERSRRWVVLASGVEDDENALRIHSPARVLGATLKAGETRWRSNSRAIARWAIWCRQGAASPSTILRSARATALPSATRTGSPSSQGKMPNWSSSKPHDESPTWPRGLPHRLKHATGRYEHAVLQHRGVRRCSSCRHDRQARRALSDYPD